MKGFVQDIEGLAVTKDEFRRVLYTAKHCLLVVSSWCFSLAEAAATTTAAGPGGAAHTTGEDCSVSC
jgi:hypothetical protein